MDAVARICLCYMPHGAVFCGRCVMSSSITAHEQNYKFAHSFTELQITVEWHMLSIIYLLTNIAFES